MYICRKCNTAVKEENLFCKSCGQKLEGDMLLKFEMKVETPVSETAKIITPDTKNNENKKTLKMKFKNLKFFAAMVTIIFILTAASYIVRNYLKENGNVNEGNLSIFAHQGKWTYFTHITSDSKFQNIIGAVYKFNEDKPVPIKFSDEAAGRILVKGNWIYYIDMNENSGCIFRMRTDGSQKEKLADSASFEFRLFGNYLYFKKYSEAYDLLRVKIDGSSNETIGSDVLSFYIQGNKIYYISGVQPGVLYKMNLDGSDIKKITEINGPIQYINDNYIYYNKVDSKETKEKNLLQAQYYAGNTGPLYRMRKDGTERQLVIDENITSIFVRSNHIYYKPLVAPMTDTDNYDFYRTDLNGKNKTKLTLDGYFIGISDKWVYYVDTKNSEVYRTTVDFKKKQKIETDIFKPN